MPKVSDDDLARRRLEILDSARTCFAEYGYEGATVRRLEEATGRTRGAIFHHFGDKQGLFLALAREDAIQMAEVAATRGLIDVMRSIIADPDGYGWALTRTEVIRQLRTDPSFRKHWEKEEQLIDNAVKQRINDQVAAGVMRTDVDPATIYSLLDVVFEGVLAVIGSSESTEGLPAALDLLEDALRKKSDRSQ